MRNKCLFIITLLAFLLSPLLSIAQNEPGAPVLFNNNWLFYKGDITDGSAGGAASVNWEQVQLPHDWSIQGPFSEEWASATGYLPGGIGWYKKTFTTSKNWAGQQVYIYFDGVYKNSEVWINGHYLGKRPNGFIAFQYELTPFLNYSGNNTITVKVDHSEFADSRWYTGSGIYRNVYLIVKNPTHFDLWGLAVNTPEVSAKNASITVKASIRSKKAKEKVDFKITLLDASGHPVLSANKKLVTSDSINEVQIDQDLRLPKLWSVEHPYLYTLVASLTKDGKVIDVVKQPIGVRSIRFDKDKGFFLNNISTKLKGVCIHDDAGALGVAIPEEVWARRLKILKGAGVNALRLSHNPHADYLYDLCDQMGFMVMDEAFDEWEIGKNKWVKGRNIGTPLKDGYNEYFKEWADRDLQDMVLRDRNHPSIILWSIGNEIDYPNDPYSHPILNTGNNPQIYGKGYLPDHPPASNITAIAKRLVSDVKRIDTTRPVTAALAGVIMSNEVGYPEALDVVGYNYQEYRYVEDHKKYPDRIIYGSENSMQANAWAAVDTNEYISGQFLWTGIDYMGEAGKWPQRSSGAGIIDLAGFKKPEYFFRQSLWAAKPMAFIGATPISNKEDGGTWSHRRVQHTWNWPAGSRVTVECFTNCDEAELFINGKSQGRQSKASAVSKIPHWDVDFQPGAALVKGYKNGVVVSSDTIRTAADASVLTAHADQTIFKPGHSGLSQVEIKVLDNNGNQVYSAKNEIQVMVNGPARLLGLESGSTNSHESYQANTRAALNGQLLAYIQTDGRPGSVNIKITSAGLKPVSLQLIIKQH
jgi:beta-galactosidase/beta-glucuronidase